MLDLSIGALAAVSAICGMIVHLRLFIHGEWHLQAPWIASAHLMALTVLYYLLSRFVPTSERPFEALLAIFGSYTTTLFASITIYRAAFHPLKSFPGPTLFKLSKLWHTVRCIKRKNFLIFHEMYEKHGEIVRTGPNEISIFRPDAIELLEAHKSKTTRSEWYDVLYPKSSLVFVRDELDHSLRRRVWSRAMSQNAIESYLPRLLTQVKLLLDLIDSYGGKPVLINDAMAWFSFDSMGEMVLNKTFGMMTSNQWHPKILLQTNALAMLGIMNEVIWAVRLVFAFTPWFGYVKDWLEMVNFCDEQMIERMKLQGKQNDIASYFIEEYESNDQIPLQKRKDILSGNVVTAMVAGSDTTRPSLIAVWYMLTKYPEHQEKIYKELLGKDITNLSSLASASHMNACINEAMRLIPAAMTGASRITGDHGLWVAENVWIPPKTKVLAPRYSVMRLPTAFREPTSFIPERWTSRPDLVLDARAFAPFGSGPRLCVGKGLAMAEIRLITAGLITRYKTSFPSGFDVDSVERNMTDQVTSQPGDCWLKFEPRSN